MNYSSSLQFLLTKILKKGVFTLLFQKKNTLLDLVTKNKKVSHSLWLECH